MSETAYDRFLASVNKTDACWIWEASTCTKGYGQFSVSGKKTLAHRFAYEAFVGAIPEGLTIDHLCRNRRCVNPDHLEAVTMRENILRGTAPSAIHARKTHCVRGHEFTEANTHRPLHDPRERRCRRCDADAHRKAYHRLASLPGEQPG